MEVEEMKNLSKEQLEGQIETWRRELLKIRVEAGRLKKAENPHRFGQLRKLVARAYTFIRQKQMQESAL